MRALALVALLSGVAFADAVEVKFGGQIASDIRYRLNGEEIPSGTGAAPFPSQQRLLRYGFSRNENLIKGQLTLSIGQKVKAVADVDFVWYGYSDIHDIDSETLHEKVDPYRLEAHAAYVDIYKLLPHLDLRMGRQVVVWGTADKFNPTNNLNSLDYSDPLLFGKALANQMIRFDYNPWQDIIITAVWVPVFRPAQLPRTAPLALTQVYRPAPVQEDDIRATLGNLAVIQNPQQVQVAAMMPDTSIQNSQVGLRIAGRIPKIDTDVSLSYYHGRFGIPTPSFVVNGKGGLVTAYVMWPRMDVLGFDFAGAIEKLGGLGYWIEGAVTWPQHVTYGIYNDAFGGHDPITFNDMNQINIPYTESGKRPTVIPDTPFVKLTAGFDYSFNKYLYTNVQYVHGFIDEFGNGKTCFATTTTVGGPIRCESRLGEYLVLGADLKFFSDALLIRFFGAFKLPHIDDQPLPYAYGGLPAGSMPFTAVLFPQIAWAVWDATELSIGAFVFLGDRASKFGDPSTGASEIFAKAKFTY
jgi:hypothetical protein